MKIFIHPVICLVLISVSYGQPKTELNKYYSEKTVSMTDSVLGYNKLFMDTLFLSFDSTYHSLISDYDTYYRDSVYKPLKDSLNSFRLDSLNTLSSFLKSRINALSIAFKDSLNPFFTEFESAVEKSKQEYEECKECEEIDDYYDQLDEYSDVLDSISSDFQDNLYDYYDSLEATLSDSVDFYTDSLSDYSEILLENQYAEDELKDTLDSDSELDADDYFKLILDINYYNHNTYRGRDYGYYINYLTPTLSYEHPLGFGISAAVYLTYNSDTKGLDGGELDAYYSHDFSKNIGGTIMYAHYFFSGDSKNSKSLLTESISAEVNFEYPYFTFTPNFNLDFGKGQSQFSLFLYASSPINISNNFLKGTLGIEPTITGTYGEQTSILFSQKVNRRGKTVNIPKDAKVTFSILDYELTLPLVYTYKDVTVKPYATLIVPFNVLYNAGPTDPFFTFTIEVNVPFNLK